MTQRHENARQILKKIGQEHLLAFWDQLDKRQRAALLNDIDRLPFDELHALARLAALDHHAGLPDAELQPPKVDKPDHLDPATIERGRRLIAEGKVAAFTVAGGQGTRLGFDGPKGAFPISPVKNKPLFQLFAESLRATDDRYKCRTPWYVMTSPANHDQTRACFRENNHFGLPPDQVIFFQQGVMPVFDPAGKILLDQHHRVALAPDGHGGSLLALARTGMLADMKRRGIEHISYFQVDNPLVRCVDPRFIGLHDERRSDMSSKALPKADDFERVGHFAIADGRLMVIEYSDLPERLATQRNPDGSRRFDAGSIAVHVLRRDFVERLTADPAAFGLPWHRARKKSPYVDTRTGQRVEPDEPNAVKLEAFVFDALPLAENPVVLETARDEEFSPVKNATGVDSVDTARRDISRRAARWLEAAGVQIARTTEGDPDGTFEISALAALSAEDLRQRAAASLVKIPAVPLPPGEKLYIE